ncbi:hypothetical protein [Salimicrobium halophilum]|uniref:Uncharacterized protein n=1 Tax=Salimicrobium halophilum TaxID=86666 RepID=A0A1G8VSZ8_9BACI|nr:hypothetical protein [Salimicrobium halophilum]SDJ69154.1 hypothetical protein SAMN04490247_2884 [Salimicrobium halophilum]
MSDRDLICKACDGHGLLRDDESWQYTCTICSGTGFATMTQKTTPPSTDDMNRVME